jgi:small-conductance mechanosensitive channel
MIIECEVSKRLPWRLSMMITFLSLINYFISLDIFKIKKQTRLNLLIYKIIKVTKIVLFLIIVFIGYLFAWLTGDKP